jgi:hypothetical protein
MSRKQGADMSDENNRVENAKVNEQELSPKELEGVSGGGLNFTKIEMTYTPQDGHTDAKPTTNS